MTNGVTLLFGNLYVKINNAIMPLMVFFLFKRSVKLLNAHKEKIMLIFLRK
jgi:hypothetical protein